MWLSEETNPAKGTFHGNVEEVATGRELSFRSLEDFLAFVQDCLRRHSDDGSIAPEP
jgi:hypothetical protein